MFEQIKNKKILITGHTGFKGSWLALWLVSLGAEVIGYSLPPKTERDNYVLTKLSKKIKEYLEDIRDLEKVNQVIKSEKPDIIFHLAAQPLVLESFKSPYYTFDTNIIGSLNVIEVFRKSDHTFLLVVITTDKVYENFEFNRGYKEDDRLGGKDPYSASKSCVEIISKSYQESFFKHDNKALVTVRAGNVIGGGDWSDNRIVPDCIRSIEKNEIIKIRNPNSIRPWQFVLEPLSGYLMLSEKILKGHKELIEPWNFGPNSGNSIKVIDIVDRIIKFYGNGKFSISQSEQQSAETNTLLLDIRKAREKLNWKPVLNIDETIKLTVEWYKNYKNSDVEKLVAEQINFYESKWKLENLI